MSSTPHTPKFDNLPSDSKRAVIIVPMRSEKSHSKLWLLFSFALMPALVLISCSTAPTLQEALQPSPIPLTPYNTPTPTQHSDSSSATGSMDQSPTQSPTPTATPFIYIIQSGDTLLAIAQRYNITLDKLLAANPAIDPNFLIVGDEVIIPSGEGSSAAFPAPTPISVDLGQPSCYPTADEGLWCLLLAENPLAQTIENISAQITLSDPAGERVNQQIAIAPLNVVSAGEAIPLAVFFPGPIPGNVSARAELVTALPSEPDSDRYLEISIDIDKTEIAGNFSEVEGTITVLENGAARPANRTWLAVVALDANGSPAGMRKWASTAQVAPGDSIAFHVNVYSLGPAISEIKLLGEAQP